MESSEVFINEEIEFSLDEKDYFWIGSYEVVTESEDGDFDVPPYSDTTINILGTIQLARMDRETGVLVDIMPTRAVTDGVIEEIIRRL
jgi:hypothetical protein